MLTTFRTTLLALACSLLFVACQKELTDKDLLPATSTNPHSGNSSGTSVFKLNGAPDTCTNYIVSGTYTSGSATNASHTARIEVNVITAGTFAITTTPTNGLTFSAHGTFDAPGMQTLVLNASGTPETAGTFNYWPGSASCSFPVTVVSAAPQVAAGELDCAQAWSEGTFTSQVAMTDSNKLLIPISVTNAGTYSVQTDPVNGTTFSGSGSLDQGAQTIVLTGSGTPQVAGSYLLTVTLGASTCSFWITFQ